jgi:hypothetical protein
LGTTRIQARTIAVQVTVKDIMITFLMINMCYTTDFNSGGHMVV